MVVRGMTSVQPNQPPNHKYPRPPHKHKPLRQSQLPSQPAPVRHGAQQRVGVVGGPVPVDHGPQRLAERGQRVAAEIEDLIGGGGGGVFWGAVIGRGVCVQHIRRHRIDLWNPEETQTHARTYVHTYLHVVLRQARVRHALAPRGGVEEDDAQVRGPFLSR